MKLSILPVIAVLAVGLATACGGSSSSTNTSSSAPASSSGGGAYGKPASTPAASSGAASIKTGSGKPGTFLVDSQGRALYLWQADTGMQSTCSGACAQAWPPLTTTGKPQAGSGGKASRLGTTKRSDGTLEVTNAGHPLYYFAGDSGAGQTNGQGSDGFGAEWYVVSPLGKAVEKP
jgi:predicted lipoprotein with Yx(FWY)xxD motif